MKKRVLIPLLLACLLAVLLPAAALAATANNISYYDWNDSTKQLEEKICSAATVVSSGDTTWGDDGNNGWYVVSSNVTINSRITVSGDVHLILMDGCTLTAQKGIQVQDNDDDCTNGSPNALTIYGQAGGTGGLTVPELTNSNNAAIGGTSGVTGACGTVTINGGVINVKGKFGAGIGGYADIDTAGGKLNRKYGGAGGRITINGGTVTATSGWGAGIGGGRGDFTRHGGVITINGGTVTASSRYGASIGGGQLLTNRQDECDNGADVTISGGIVIATGSSGMSIGRGQNGYDFHVPGRPGTFNTTSDGNAVIFADSIHDQSDKANWHGVIFEGNTGKVYGGTVTLCGGFTIGNGKKLTIDNGMTLVNNHIILVEGSVTNNGTVQNTGKIYVDGTFTGMADNLYYPLTVTDATANKNISDYENKTYGKAGSGITLTPDAPQQQGIKHSGWDVTPETVQISNNEFTMPKSAVSIAARFSSISYTVNFDTNGGSAIADKDVYWDDAVLGGVANPTRSGWTFTGWMYGDKPITAQTKYSELAASDTEMSITLTAQWTNKDYTVTFDSNGGSAVKGKTVYWDDAVLGGVANPTKPGWTFTGWKCGDKPVTAQTKYSELAASDTEMSITLTAQWTNKDYTVTFDTAGGNAITDKAVYWDDAVLGGVANPTKTGWTFTGWMYGDKPVTAQTKYSELTASDTEMSITLTAQWTNKDYTVAFDTAGGNAITDKAVYWDDAVLGGVTNPTKTGWTFTGWMCGDKPVTAQTKYSELAASDTEMSITLTAQWTNKDYTVTFDTAGGSAIADKDVYWDDEVLGGVANPARSGFAFAGWMCGGKPVTAQTKYSELAASDTEMTITLTAQWSDSTAPVIFGIEDGEVYCSAPAVTVTDNKGIVGVTVNGTPVTLGSNGEFTLPATNSAQTIVATDAEGNSTQVTVTVNDGHRGGMATCVNQAVCIHCGEAYGEVGGTNHIHLEHVSASEATVTETGNIEYWYCTDCRHYFSDADGKNVITQEDTITPKLPPEIIDGMGQSILAGEKKALAFTSNASFDDFKRVELDGKTLSAQNYTVREGSTIVTLKAEYVATLAVGEHTIGVVSENGTAETAFSVNPQLPQTGDNSRIALWMALLLISGGLMTAACIRKRSAR